MSPPKSRRHAVISGGSSGIGLAIAKGLYAKGWNLSLIARDPKKLNRTQEMLCGRPHERARVCLLSADVTDALQSTEAGNRATTRMGPPDLLVTSAGLAAPGHFQALPLELHRKAMEVNYFGTLHLISALAPVMGKAGRGHIALVSSGAGLVGVFGYSAYSPSKFAVRGLAEVLRAELRPSGIGVSVVYPPDTDTPQLQEENASKPAETRAILGRTRTLSAESVAKAVLLGVERNRFIIAPGWEMNTLARLHSVLLPIMNRYFDRRIARTRSVSR